MLALLNTERAMPKKKPLTQQTLHSYFLKNGIAATTGYADCLIAYKEQINEIIKSTKNYDELKSGLTALSCQMDTVSNQITDLLQERPTNAENEFIKASLRAQEIYFNHLPVAIQVSMIGNVLHHQDRLANQ